MFRLRGLSGEWRWAACPQPRYLVSVPPRVRRKRPSRGSHLDH
jgi:hypothetical protein